MKDHSGIGNVDSQETFYLTVIMMYFILFSWLKFFMKTVLF